MSVVEMLMAIYSSLDLDRIRTKAPDRSRVIVSKGHCAAAVYAVMAHYGLLDFATLETYHQDDSDLPGHVSHYVDLVEHSTGALGHGLSVACGCAIGLRSRGFNQSQVFALVGDGEIQEGSIWEAVMLAKHHNLSNLITLVDNNKISSITNTYEVLDMRPLKDRFAGFGLKVYEVDGHNLGEITAAIEAIKADSEVSAIICHTIKGYGVPFAENEPIWHYRPLNDKDYQAALAHLEQALKA
jgi:transketolase